MALQTQLKSLSVFRGGRYWYRGYFLLSDVLAVTARIALASLLIGTLLTGSLATQMNARVGLRDTLAASLVAIVFPGTGLYIREKRLGEHFCLS